MRQCILAMVVCGAALCAFAAPVVKDKTPEAPKPFRGYIRHKDEGYMEIPILGFRNGAILSFYAGKTLEVTRAQLTSFSWGKPEPLSEGNDLTESNRFNDLIARLAPFTSRDFVLYQAPNTMFADRIIGMVADAYVELGQYTNGVRYLENATNTLALTLCRARLLNRIGRPLDAIKLLEPLRTSTSLSYPQLGVVHYELGMALLNTSTNYEEALNTLLATKVFYRPDLDTIARAELAAVRCYRGMNDLRHALLTLSNMLKRVEVAGVDAANSATGGGEAAVTEPANSETGEVAVTEQANSATGEVETASAPESSPKVASPSAKGLTTGDLANPEYAVVTNEAQAALAEVLKEIERERELKRRFGE